MKRCLIFDKILILIIVLFFSNNALAGITVDNYSLISSKRVNRVEYEYTYQARLNNDGLVGYTGVSATLVSNSPYTVVVDNQLSFPDIAANSNVNSIDTFTIRHNRSYPLNWKELIWAAAGTVMPHNISIVGMVVGGAPMMGTLNIKDSSTPSRSSFSSIAINGSYTLNIDSGWQPPFFLWADGYANGKYMKMLSYLDLETDQVSKTVNVTPATTAILSSAMGMQAGDIDPASAQIPSPTEMAAVKDKVQRILETFFMVFGLPESFDLFESPIEIGTGSDSMFDGFNFTTDTTNNIVVASKMDPAVELAITAATTPDESAALANNAQDVTSAIKQFGSYFSMLYSFYKDSPSDLAQLQSVKPLIAEDIVNAGSFGVDDLLASWVSDQTRAPAIGTEYVSCSIYRPMKVQNYGSMQINEMPDAYLQGVWAIVTVRINGKLHHDLVSFVDVGGGNWKYYGNRRPFYSGGYVRARCEKTFSAIGSLVYERGLMLWNNDIGNRALTNLGMMDMAIFNPAMPKESSLDSSSCLRMARLQGGLSTQYGITNVSTQYGSPFYFHRGDGAARDLDEAALEAQENKEFIMIGLNNADEPVYAWAQILGSTPPAMNEIVNHDDQYFASIKSPEDFSDVKIPGLTPMNWALPSKDELLPFFSKLEWYNNNWLFQESYVYNPALYGPANYRDFTDQALDTSGYYETAREISAVVMMHLPANQNEFRVMREYNPWAVKSIEVKSGELILDVQKVYSDNIFSRKLEASVRATDRAVNRIQADIKLDLAEAEGNIDTIKNNMYSEIRLLYQPAEHYSRNDRTDLFMVGVRLQPYFGKLYLVGYVWGSRNADGSSLYLIPSSVGSFPLNKEINFGSPYTLAVEYVSASNSLKIKFDGESSLFSMAGLPFDPADFQAAEIRTQVVGIDNANDMGHITTFIDNVWIDGIVYDDFNSDTETGIGVNKWWIRAFE